ITVYALSKKSGVARATIHRFQEILDLLDKDKYPEIPLKTAVVDTVRIKTVDDAISVINTLTKVYNETKDKYNEALKRLSETNLKIARLETEKKELEIMINRR
ncbi:hypothetical protein, partial [uncultured Anaerovibrio sp.]|uniref:hypothetical protein n=1 Tax=uncultured Anaerovibrio sp. TaxID=361586 RepID=UPI0025F99F75